MQIVASLVSSRLADKMVKVIPILYVVLSDVIAEVLMIDGGSFMVITELGVEDREAYNAGILREFSFGFVHKWLDPHSGEEMENVLLELSFTSRARRTGILGFMKSEARQR